MVAAPPPRPGLPGFPGTGQQYGLDGELYDVCWDDVGSGEPPVQPPEPPDSQGRLGGGEQQPLPKKESRRRRWARQSRWLKGHRGGYLELGQYYRSWNDDVATQLRYCLVSWSVWRRGGDRKLRGHGCGDRVRCPACSVYQRDTLARESAEDMLNALEGLEIAQGLRPSSYGLKLVLTVPKETSAWIDASPDRMALLSGLFHAQQEFIKKQFGKGVGGVGGLDFAGESDPTEAHYHANAYIFPARKDGDVWKVLPHWVNLKGESGRLIRQRWAECLKKHLGVNAPGLVGLAEADLWFNFLKGAGSVHHWLRYLYRSPIYDLWKGWQSGSVEDGVEYRYWKGGEAHSEVFSAESVAAAMGRVFNLPFKFKRVRWFGCFSDSVRATTMGSLALVSDEVEREGEELDGWVYDSGPYYLVKFRKGGGLLLKDRDGVFYSSKDLADFVDFQPEGVLTGSRTRWRPPG